MDIAKPSSLHILASLKLPVLCLARLECLGVTHAALRLPRLRQKLVSRPIDPCSTFHLTTSGQQSAHATRSRKGAAQLQRPPAFLALGAAIAQRPVIACRC